MTTKVADGKGRIALGSRFANHMFLIDDTDPSRIIITPAVAIPAHEAWLYQNEKALSLVRKGLAAAKEGRFSTTPPDLIADAALAAEMKDE